MCWRSSPGLVPYPAAVAAMEERVAAISGGASAEEVWLLEHPSLYTAGSSANPADLLDPQRFPVFQTGRGGQFTYHGPGQLVAYLMLDLNQRGRNLRAFVAALEEWLILTLSGFGIEGERRDGRVGVWVRQPDKGFGREAKIAAVGIRVRRWVTYHGLSLNLDPVLDHYAGIVACGLPDYAVTSFADLGIGATRGEVELGLRTQFEALFGPTTLAEG